KLWRDEYDEEGVALEAAIPSTADLGPGDRPSAVAVDLPEYGTRDWFIKTVDLIRQRFFTLKDFSGQGRAYFSEDYDFDPAAIEKNLNKFPDLQQWMPELADKFESEFRDGSAFHELAIEAVVKSFTEEKGTKLGVIMNG